MTDYQHINLEEYTRTGEGATAVAYTHKTEPRLAKLYNKGFEADEALRDFRITKAVYDMGLPSPEQIAAAVLHLLPYAAVRIPFMLNMAYRTPISEGLAKFVISLINVS